MWPSHQGLKPAKWLYSKEWTRFRMERRLTSKLQARVLMPPAAPAGAAADVVDVAGIAGAVKRKGNEYFSAVYSAACSDVVVDGRCPSGRRSRLSAIAGVGTAASRLSDHP